MQKPVLFFIIIFTFSSLGYSYLNAYEGKHLPKLILSNEQWEAPNGGSYFSNGQIYQHPDAKFNRHYFRLENEESSYRVNYLATNLAETLKPIPQAYNKLIVYKTLRIITPCILTVGIATTIVSLATLTSGPKDEDGNYPPPNLAPVFIGLGISFSSWIPRIASKGMVEEAANIYNSSTNND